MNTIPLYQVDAFTREPFKGNPAAVCLLTQSYDAALLQAIAAEMNLSETAFVMRLDVTMPWKAASMFSLRWFTPAVEVRLCGHATLATAAVLFNVIGVEASTITFQTRSGDLLARRVDDAIVDNAIVDDAIVDDTIVLGFPLDPPQRCDPPADVLEAIGVLPPDIVTAVSGTRGHKLLIHLKDTAQVRALTPDFTALLAAKGMDPYRGLSVTAAGGPDYDFISRFFAPWVGINEDPVTGSAHTLLTPYWAELLGKPELRAYQASARGGELRVRLAQNDRVELTGNAVVVMRGELRV
ncbi:MAG: PhzF family phenazine biosynthesis isomerase [Anaerolineae bacterium]|nr:PhzF family phenazine biosynthesis isomerase [Anaerolineae bacterium]